MEIINLSHVNKFFGEDEGRTHILKDINLSIQQGEFVSIIGASGSGKSTLMNIIGCLDEATDGIYKLQDRDVTKLDIDELSKSRQEKFGFIFQKYNLIPSLNVLENVALPAVYSGMAKSKRDSRAIELLERLGLSNRIYHKTTKLSGGQQQRVSIARALMNGGDIILADEPTGALDSATGKTVMKILQDLHSEGHTIIVVTHDREVAKYAERTIEIRDGEIISDLRTVEKPTPHTTTEELSRNNSLGGSLFGFVGQYNESLKMALGAIIAHKLRSILTMLGVIIGITAVVLVFALGNAAQSAILTQINSIGTNTLTVFNGTLGGNDNQSGGLTIGDVNAIKAQPYVASVSPQANFTSDDVTYHGNTVDANISGVGPELFSMNGLKLLHGSIFNSYAMSAGTAVAVIGSNAQKELFPNVSPIGKTIWLDQQPFKILGVVNVANNFTIQQNSLNVWIPYTTLINRLVYSKYVSAIGIKLKPGINSTSAKNALTDLLLVRHGQKNFSIFDINSIETSIRNVTDALKLLISSIAFISLCVGGIGVMNIMLVSVTERTKEIGTRMAIGAYRRNILQQFLTEAALICAIGGALGIAFAYLLAQGFNALKINLGGPLLIIHISFSIALYSILIASFIGIIFGFLPAHKASKLNPIEALSYE